MTLSVDEPGATTLEGVKVEVAPPGYPITQRQGVVPKPVLPLRGVTIRALEA